MLRVLVVAGVVAEAGDGPARFARSLRDAGHEVVLVGDGASAAQVAATALQEDVDRVVLVGEGLDADAVRHLLAARGADDVEVRLAD